MEYRGSFRLAGLTIPPLRGRGEVRSLRLYPFRKWQSPTATSGLLNFDSPGKERHVHREGELSAGRHPGRVRIKWHLDTHIPITANGHCLRHFPGDSITLESERTSIPIKLPMSRGRGGCRVLNQGSQGGIWFPN